ncbi:MAG: NUDIX domain-containing protein [Candidatus Nomurabacteria bacterium]|jgi:8-oxo-dGTP pyrophosphatase MutT (NUDIX family)|nr:NUDIX domain-containing protein [Candidatus Nomurabacteria bacterium]
MIRPRQTAIIKQLSSIENCLYRLAARALIARNGKILLTKELDGVSLPGGGVEYGEDLIGALRRELREEVQLDLTPDQISQRPIAIDTGFFRSADAGFRHQELDGMPKCSVIYEVILRPEQNPTAGENQLIWADASTVENLQFTAQNMDKPVALEFLRRQLAK